MNKDLLTLSDLTVDEINELFDRSAHLKKHRINFARTPLRGKSIGMIFAKSSTRTRVSFEVGIHELGGFPLYLDQGKMQVGRGETVADTARVLSRFLHGIVIRTFSQADVEELGRHASIPVINALTDEYHPCQILADLFTIKEHSGKVEGVKLVFFGDGQSNIANSLINAARLIDFELVIAAPAEFAPRSELIGGASNIRWESNPLKAAQGADYVYTDVWVSMGFEEEKAHRLQVFAPYQINQAVIREASPTVKLLHCLPAHRGEELSAEVMDSDCSIVFDEAENRLHVQKALLEMLIK